MLARAWEFKSPRVHQKDNIAVGNIVFLLGIIKLIIDSNSTFYALFFRYSSIAFAAVLPAPIADITVAAPVTASPPA